MEGNTSYELENAFPDSQERMSKDYMDENGSVKRWTLWCWGYAHGLRSLEDLKRLIEIPTTNK